MCSLAGFAQLPKPYFGYTYGVNQAGTYTGFDSTIYRAGFFPSGTFELKNGEPRKRSRLGFSMLAPVIQIPVVSKDKLYRDSLEKWLKREGTSSGHDGCLVGAGLDLLASITYDRAIRETFDDFNKAKGADYIFSETGNSGQGVPFKYGVWLNFDYLELSSMGRLGVWWFHGKDRPTEKWINGALDRLFEPVELHFDFGFVLAVPVSKYGIYYKSNDPTPGIDEQVTQNMNEVLKPNAMVATIMGFGFRLGRVEFTYRWREWHSDAFRTLGNSYGFREWDERFIRRSDKNMRECGITIYLFGGGPRKGVESKL